MMRQSDEKGFILATSLVMMLLMTMLTAAVFISVDATQKSSISAESSAEAFYYAETAVEYMKWSLDNDADFDSYTYPSAVKTSGADVYTFAEPDVRGSATGDPYTYLPNPKAVGDYTEWRANRFNPSGDNTVKKIDGTYVQNTGGLDVYGQLMYYDNSPLADRMISYQNDDIYSNGEAELPELFEIHENLPRYIMLTIGNDGTITPSMPPVNDTAPWHNNVEGTDYPTNGALVWLTGGNRTDDYEIDPVDNYYAPLVDVNVNPVNWDPYAAYIGRLACDLNEGLGKDLQDESAACLTSGTWVDDADYGLVIYALGYVRGKPQRLVRVVYE